MSYCVQSRCYERKRAERLVSIVDVVRQNTDIPCAIGFRISTPQQAKKMAEISDGAIVGSGIVRFFEKYGKDAPGHIGEYVKSMKDGLRSCVCDHYI